MPVEEIERVLALDPRFSLTPPEQLEIRSDYCFAFSDGAVVNCYKQAKEWRINISMGDLKHSIFERQHEGDGPGLSCCGAWGIDTSWGVSHLSVIQFCDITAKVMFMAIHPCWKFC